jgi:Ca2+-binding RTX toxin-like protein
MSTISTVPFVISTPGTYTLTQNLVFSGTSGAAIEIRSSGVTLNLNGFSIIGSGVPETTATGISATNCSNITIANGSVSGFMYGVRLTDTSSGAATYGGHSILQMSVSDCTFRGIQVLGPNSLIEDCQVSRIFGTSVYANAFACGIESMGPNGRITSNDVREIYPGGTGEGLGIAVSNNGIGTVVANNTIVNSKVGALSSFGIWVGGASSVLADGNVISNYVYGQGWSSTNSGEIRNNSIFGSSRPYFVNSTQVTDGGGNLARGTALADTIVGSFLSETIVGLAGGDRLWGGAGDDVVFGKEGHDRLYGESGDDNLIGEGGDDYLVGGRGADLLQGGSGNDTVSYEGSNRGVQIDLATGRAAGGHADGDVLLDIENVGGSSFADRLAGDAGRNILFGGDGNDVLYGSEGADVLDGGAGIDTVDYAGAGGSGFTASLHHFGWNTGAAAGDRYANVENLILGDGSDWGYGNALANKIYGRGGNDTLFGMAGNDVLFGEDGDDNLIGGDGSDHLFGGVGADLLQGGAGFDYVRYDEANYPGFVVSLGNPDWNTGPAAGDQFVSIEGLIMSSGNDTAYGGAGDNVIYGRAGDDTLYGLAGRDTLYGEAGADRFVFNTAPSVRNMDIIADFVSRTDSIGLAPLYFGAADAGDGSVRLISGAAAVATTSLATIVFDSSTRIVWFDANGATEGGRQPIAELPGVAGVIASDFYFI